MKNQTCTSFSTGQPHVKFGKISHIMYMHAKCKIVNITNIRNLWRLKGLNETMTHWGRSPNSMDSKILLCLLLSSCMTYYLEVWCECLSSARTLAWAHNYQLSQNLQLPWIHNMRFLRGKDTNARNYCVSEFSLHTDLLLLGWFLYEDLKYLGITELKNNSVLGMDHLWPNFEV